MDLLAFLLRSSRRLLAGIVLASLLSGAASAALIAIIHRALSASAETMPLIATAFVTAVAIKTALQFTAQLWLVRFAQDTVLRLCRNLCDRALAAPLLRLESLGVARLMATLTDDVETLGAAMQMVPTIVTNAAVVLGCAIYLAWLSWQAFLLCAALVVIGVLGYRWRVLRAQVPIEAARDGRDRLFAAFRSLIGGIKELKLNRARREQFVADEIDETTQSLRVHNIAAMRHIQIADVWTQFLFFALIAMLLFGAPYLTAMPPLTLSGYVFAALYMMAPIWGLMAAVPTFLRGRVALAKMLQIDASLEPVKGQSSALQFGNGADALAAPGGAEVAGASASATSPLPLISLEGVAFAYPAPAGEDTGFQLGPLDLRLEAGELVFVTGGNGCGKSTLVKLLTGLYEPNAGQIRVRGECVDAPRRDAYRQNFAAVFADFHLFDRLFGLQAAARPEEVARYLDLLGMKHKVQVRGDRLSTTTLSSGQQRRLALLSAYLEDRPVYVFDEWAADQDPTYKAVFYTRLLPDLKARGKCVVVVTHDDRYFALGDRVLKLEAGRIVV